MNTLSRVSILTSALTLGALSFTSLASAQTTTQNRNVVVGEGTPSGALPPSRSDNDPQPAPAAPVVPAGGIVEQAGVGGTTAYARAGVLELGGNIGFNVNSSITSVSIAPTIGWFFADNLQISGIVNYQFSSVAGRDAHSLAILAEPSFHLPFSRTVFGFVGVGLGLSYVDGPGAGFALAPRLGVNLAVGRSGILTPALQFSYSTNDAIQTNNGTYLAVSTSFGANIGYTVMW
jgi:hypothetical protein